MTDLMLKVTKAESDVKPSMEQQHAIDLCCDMSESIVGITGGAGTGKTLILGRVYKELKDARKSVVLAAPTGRAAKRIKELTGIEAKTIHRLLEFPMPNDFADGEDYNEPRRNQGSTI